MYYWQKYFLLLKYILSNFGRNVFFGEFSYYIEDKRKCNWFSKMSFMTSFSENSTDVFLTTIFVIKVKIFMSVLK